MGDNLLQRYHRVTHGKKNMFSSGFKGSQAVPARPFGRGMFERGWSFKKQIGM
jgi:hypothetical protein